MRKGAYENALRECLKLELKIHDYAEALKTWDRLQKLHSDDDAWMKPVLADLGKLRTDDRAYEVSGVLSDESWQINLYKRHFRITVSDGYIAQLKLLCSKRYASFAFDPKVQYPVNDAWGRLRDQIGRHVWLPFHTLAVVNPGHAAAGINRFGKGASSDRNRFPGRRADAIFTPHKPRTVRSLPCGLLTLATRWNLEC